MPIVDSRDAPVDFTGEYVPVVFLWEQKGPSKVHLVGSFNEWQAPVEMERKDGMIFSLVQDLKPGTYQFRFIVDGTYKHSESHSITTDFSGNVNNYIVVKARTSSLDDAFSSGDKKSEVTDVKLETSLKRSPSTPELSYIGAKKEGQSPQQLQLSKRTGTFRRGASDMAKIAQEKAQEQKKTKRKTQVIGKAKLYHVKALSTDDQALHKRLRMHCKIDFNPFEVIVMFSSGGTKTSSKASSVDWCWTGAHSTDGAPRTPRSMPDSPAAQKELLWYDADMLPLLVRVGLQADTRCLSFNPGDCHEQIQLSYSNMCAIKNQAGMYRSVRGTPSIPFDIPVYFEVYVAQHARGICIGVSTPSFPLNCLLGSRANSAGLYSSGEFISQSKWTKYGAALEQGVTVGCHVVLSKSGEGMSASLSYYLDGSLVANSPRLVAFSDDGPLLPTVSLYQGGSRIIGMFSGDDLKYTSHLPQGTHSFDKKLLRFS
mmetsp:Transcript_6703/g.11529  ORF Transcript_6703/g.11529 Transcript_6703/m.11529 type:complete len:484 (-) Transcript_6703:962-2413(-)|eukprot:CAMPEP_0196657128 /NCGR_PEP_ID=MMETSP1086-20130531/21994_1 /TAXON_ID=77921 /ORGANISM="Cyanoptyche  gloeocystis , Strain SAG4.97" /LENGTH=483 /DNA_ID=CAMNT_0041990153 /DNA_START=98 /DNA_END=1549 /DNA_ORIENTATION=-